MRIVRRTVILLGALAIPASATADVTFNKDVLPILQKHCQTCHRPGEVAPMSLLTFADARPWARAIKAAVLLQKMPPWPNSSTASVSATKSTVSPASLSSIKW